MPSMHGFCPQDLLMLLVTKCKLHLNMWVSNEDKIGSLQHVQCCEDDDHG